MKMADPNFWNDSQQAQVVIDENNELKSKYDNFNSLVESTEDLEVLLELAEADPTDQEMLTDLAAKYQEVSGQMQRYQLTLLLNEPYDKNNAILEIHPGAGGTESQDWGSMLLRMYDRWAE